MDIEAGARSAMAGAVWAAAMVALGSRVGSLGNVGSGTE